MLQYLKEYGQYVEITGYKDVAFDRVEAFLKADRKKIGQSVNIQFFDAELIATQEHLYFAVLNAPQAFKNKTNRSKSPAMETLLICFRTAANTESYRILRNKTQNQKHGCSSHR